MVEGRSNLPEPLVLIEAVRTLSNELAEARGELAIMAAENNYLRQLLAQASNELEEVTTKHEEEEQDEL